MSNQLVELETEAFFARDRGDSGRAIEILEKLVGINPEWEHGQAVYDLAGCYEDAGDLQKAEQNYLRALQIQPNYYIFVGGYASFLDRYGDAKEAFETYLRLLKIEQEFSPMEFPAENEQQTESIKASLYTIGERLGWSKTDVENLILRTK